MWVVSIPVWGDEYIEKWLNAALPSHIAALKHAGVEARYCVYTDQPELLYKRMRGLDEVEFYEIPEGGDKYGTFGDCHRDTIWRANRGDYVALLSADIVLSREVFSACGERFSQGYSAVVAAATRTLAVKYPAPDQLSRDLLKWTMLHPHPSIKACFYGAEGNCPWAVYFQNGDNITVRGFHLHPVAVVKDREISFKGSLDQDLLEAFERADIHVVTSRDELALAELSPPAMKFYVPGFPIDVQHIASWAVVCGTDMHWWLSTHRIIITGNGDTDDEAVWEQVMARPERAMTRKKFGDEKTLTGSFVLEGADARAIHRDSRQTLKDDVV